MSNGIYPPDYLDAVGLTRVLIPDVETDDGTTSGDYVLSDAALEGILSISGNNPKRAAAYALNAIASDQALLIKKVRTDDLSTDGPAVADALRKQAQVLFTQADEEDARLLDESSQIVYPEDGIFWAEGAPIPLYARVVGIDSCR
jgi:hypothetical protein